MFRTSYFKKFLISGSTYGATAITSGEVEGVGKGQDKSKGQDKIKGKDADKNKDKDKGTDEEFGPSGDSCDPCTGKLLRRTELPLYGQDTPEKDTQCEEPSNLEKGISAVRKELWVWHDKYAGYREKIVEVAVTGKEHTAVLIDQLRKDELPVPRSGAIAISGVAGLVLGLRGGWFKRIFYGSTCAGLMAAVCYPKEVAGISQDTLATTKKYVLITYNFIYGVKPEGLNLPSPSQLLGGPVESPDKGKGDLKISATVVPEGKPETPTNSPRPNDQSNPADKDLYSSKR